MANKAVPAGDILRAYLKAGHSIMGTTKHAAEVVAGHMFPNGGYEGYTVSVRIERYTDQAAKLSAAVAAALKNGKVDVTSN